MTGYWIFQANPDRYDIDGALQKLDEISWRVPQYAASIVPGDGLAIWRSGTEAGIIGVGRVLDHPGERPPNSDDRDFTRGPENEQERSTRVSVAVQTTTFRPKAEVASMPGWSDHQIITGPMGTVFAVSDAQWTALGLSLAELRDPPTLAFTALTPAFAWKERRKDVSPLPGGYSGYLNTLAIILTEVAASQPSQDLLQAWMSHHLAMSKANSRLSVSFLLRIGVLADRAGTVQMGDVAERWLAERDDAHLIALLHSRTRFIGEFLMEVREPLTDTEILAIANDHYGAGWQTRAQIRRRRGWLQSAGFLVETDDGRLQSTAAGRTLVGRLELHPREQAAPDVPAAPTSAPAQESPPAVLPPPALSETVPMRALIDRLTLTGNDGAQADAFERETTEAFHRLGFRATWLGKAGRTDVLLEADLGRDHGYRVIVDCKSTSRGTVSAQIDWDTINEHRKQHKADYAIIVAPGFGGGKLTDRATRHDTVLLSIDDLGELLVQHERTPLGLDTYKLLFTGDTLEDGLAAIGEVSIEVERRLDLVEAVLAMLARFGPKKGSMSAREIDLLLATQDDQPEATEEEIEDVLNALSAPLVGLLHRNDDGSVRYTSSPTTAADALRILSDRIENAAATDVDLDP